MVNTVFALRLYPLPIMLRFTDEGIIVENGWNLPEKRRNKSLSIIQNVLELHQNYITWFATDFIARKVQRSWKRELFELKSLSLTHQFFVKWYTDLLQINKIE